jgi:hypothetical protein
MIFESNTIVLYYQKRQHYKTMLLIFVSKLNASYNIKKSMKCSIDYKNKGIEL